MQKLKPDRRTARTQRSLHRSLNALVLEKGYAATTIKDIAAHADVGRSTFYAHHGSKEDLMLSGLQHLRELLLARQREAAVAPEGSDGRVLGFSGSFFEHVHEYREILSALAASEAESALTRGLKRLLADVVRVELQLIPRPSRYPQLPPDAVALFVADALMSILHWWFERNPQLPPAEVNAIFRRLVVPGLLAGTRT